MPKQVGNQNKRFVSIGYFFLYSKLYNTRFVFVFAPLACCARGQLPLLPSVPILSYTSAFVWDQLSYPGRLRVRVSARTS